jgi:monoamine oxidase
LFFDGLKIAKLCKMEQHKFDVLVIGAGAAGLIAALELALTGKSVCIIEAKDKAGGRIQTVYTPGNYPVELGAEFVHGDLPVTKELLKKAGAKIYTVGGSIWQNKNGKLTEQEDLVDDYSDLDKKFKEVKEDITVAEFFSTHLAGDNYEKLRFDLQNYVQGYYAADIKKVSTFALRDELQEGDDVQYRIEGGYRQLVDYLEQQCREKGVQFFFSQPVKTLHWTKNAVAANTGTTSFEARKVIVTVSIGVLQSDGIHFSPALPAKNAAAKALGFGHVIKVILHFEDAFWKDKKLTGNKELSDLNFLFSEETIPTWWTQHPKEKAVLVGWLGGPNSKAFDTVQEEDVLKQALAALSNIFGIDVLHLSQKLSNSYWYNWGRDPYFLGAYSYEVVNGEAFMKTILEPKDETIYFAGEGLYHGPEIGTVEAALNSGRSVAQQLIMAY